MFVFTEVVRLLGEGILEVVWALSLSHLLEKLLSRQTMELGEGEGTSINFSNALYTRGTSLIFIIDCEGEDCCQDL